MCDKDTFLSILEDSTLQYLEKRIALQDVSIKLKDILIIKIIGTGMFGNVFLVMNKKNKTTYALKTVSRSKI